MEEKYNLSNRLNCSVKASVTIMLAFPSPTQSYIERCDWEKSRIGETCTSVSDALNELAVHHITTEHSHSSRAVVHFH